MYLFAGVDAGELLHEQERVGQMGAAGNTSKRILSVSRRGGGRRTANCNMNANFRLKFLLEMHRQWRISPEK